MTLEQRQMKIHDMEVYLDKFKWELQQEKNILSLETRIEERTVDLTFINLLGLGDATLDEYADLGQLMVSLSIARVEKYNRRSHCRNLNYE